MPESYKIPVDRPLRSDNLLNKGCDIMAKAATWFAGALFLTVVVAMPALAAQYPPACPDSISIWNIQNPSAPCHPTNADTVWVGIGGIVTARDTKTSGVGFYMQLSGGGPYSGIDVFTANTIWPVAVGDSVIVRPSQVMEYNGETEVVSLTGSWGDNLYVTKVLGPTALPPFYVGNTTDFNSLPSNTALEPYECGLGKVVGRGGPLRVAKLLGTAPGAPFMVVDSACTTGICDSVLVDIGTLPNPSLGTPKLDDVLQFVQGIVGQNSGGYLIRMRDDNDWYPSVNPPTVADAYAIKDDSIRVVFDKKVTPASAQNKNNYSLATFGSSVNSATLESNGSCVMLKITNGLGHKVKETVNVSGVVAAVNGKIMVGIQSKTFWNGLTPIADIQAPELNPLPPGNALCPDRSVFAGLGSAPGAEKVTYRGVCTAAFPEGLYYVQDASSPTRAGVATYAPLLPLIVGHQYLLVTNIQEYFEETEALYNVYVRDEGVATLPTPVVQTVAVLRDTSCDASQSATNGEDYEGMLVKLVNVKSVQNAFLPGNGFDVAGPAYACPDTIHIRNVKSRAGWSYQADSLMMLDVAGIQTFSFGTMQIAPRSNADFLNHGQLNVPPGTLSKVSFSAYPNPARITKVNFALPKQADVDLSVYDLSGRKVATLARGSMSAGPYTREWNGAGAGAGVYFIRLRVGSETYNLRTISLK